jgi:NAD(P)-dependent dehydrogenase (short-subunit alcohol dehydrogenase family)
VRSRGAHDLELFERVVRVNLTGTFNLVRLVAPEMAGLDPTPSDERGVIVTTSSIAAYDGVDGGVAYAASKAGVAGMTLPLARDLAPHAIRAVSVAPGSFATPMTEGMPAIFREQLEGETPFPGRFGEPAEFADFVAKVVDSPMLNGEVVRLDGGLRMRASRLR